MVRVEAPIVSGLPFQNSFTEAAGSSDGAMHRTGEGEKIKKFHFEGALERVWSTDERQWPRQSLS